MVQMNGAHSLSEKLNVAWTTCMLIFLSFVVGIRQYFGKPVHCWVPASFTESWVEYTEQYCGSADDHWPYLDDDVQTVTRYSTRVMNFGLWMPFMLFTQAFTFLLPHLFKILMANYVAKVNITKLVNMGHEARNCVKSADCNTKIHALANYFHNYFTKNRFNGSLALIWMIGKFLYVLNAIIHLVLFNRLLNMGNIPGISQTVHFLHGQIWEHSRNFPMTSMCDFEIYVLGVTHRHTVTCVMGQNILIEMILLFAWNWVFFVLLVSMISFLQWILSNLLFTKRSDYVKKYLPNGHGFDQKKIDDFVSNFIGFDGIICLKTISDSNGEMATMNLILALWDKFTANENSANLASKNQTMLQEHFYKSLPTPNQPPYNDYLYGCYNGYQPVQIPVDQQNNQCGATEAYPLANDDHQDDEPAKNEPDELELQPIYSTTSELP